MATTYKFQITMPITDLLPRNRISNTIHLEHVTGALGDPDLATMCQDIAAMYQKRYGSTFSEIQVKAYDVDAKPNYPRATVTVGAGNYWAQSVPRELALVLSWAGANRGNKAERGRVYLNPFIATPTSSAGLRPGASQMNWALAFYTTPNESFPDLGGIDWKFGTWSHKYQKFTQAQQAWCNDDWDIQRRRGLRENTRVTAQREG